jgi:hypothetical protein
MGRIGITVEQFDRVLGPVHEGVINPGLHNRPAHRNGAGRDALSEHDDIWHDVIALGGEGVAEASKCGDHLVENQENSMPVADRSQASEIAFGSRQHARRSRHRLNDDSRDGRWPVQSNDALEFIGKMRAPRGLPPGEGLMFAIVGRRQMVDAGEQGAEILAIVDDAADRHTAEADTVITAFTADQTCTRAFAANVVIGERDLERSIDRFRPGIAEEHPIETARSERSNAARQFEGFRVRKLKRRRVVKLSGLVLDRGDDWLAVVARITTPQSGRRIENSTTLGGDVMHVLRARDQAGRLLEGPVGRKWHPEGF